MAATQTVPQVVSNRNLPTEIIEPHHGVVTLFGYGIQVYVERGHLIIKDGVGPNRREARLPRIGHSLRRVVVIGADGMVSLAALRWLSDQDAAFVMLDRDGSVLTITGPVRPSDARLRRAQALASHAGVDLQIARELIDRKLVAQEQLVRTKLNDILAADNIEAVRASVAEAPTLERVRYLESKAALAYWSAWRNVSITFPTKDTPRVPDHWQSFGTRVSPLTQSARLAVNPVNAMLNYLYAVLEAEARLAVSAQGLDPGLGILHFDRPNRDSLACDIMEPARPLIDGYVLDWIRSQPLRREWFFEQRDGNCRLMASLAVRLSETVPMWGRAVAPVAEWISRVLWSTLKKPARQVYPATRLTQSHRREASGVSSKQPIGVITRPLRICRTCGVPLKSGDRYCSACGVIFSRKGLIEAARLGRIATHTPKAEALRGDTMRRQMTEKKSWNPSDLPDWLDEQAYRARIQPDLAGLTVRAISVALGISQPYATDIRSGKRLPHPRHWVILARLAGVSVQAC